MYVPIDPLRTWNVLGPDSVFFSQPTTAWDGPDIVVVSERLGCVARCQFQSWLEDDDGSVRTHLIQCGRVAVLTADGTYLCASHASERCRHCGDAVPAGSGDACPECEADRGLSSLDH